MLAQLAQLEVQLVVALLPASFALEPMQGVLGGLPRCTPMR
jgi:hypothetical protein